MLDGPFELIHPGFASIPMPSQQQGLFLLIFKKKSPASNMINKWLLTVAFHSLVKDTVEERAAMVAECRAAVGVVFKFMLCPHILKGEERNKLAH